MSAVIRTAPAGGRIGLLLSTAQRGTRMAAAETGSAAPAADEPGQTAPNPNPPEGTQDDAKDKSVNAPAASESADEADGTAAERNADTPAADVSPDPASPIDTRAIYARFNARPAGRAPVPAPLNKATGQRPAGSKYAGQQAPLDGREIYARFNARRPKQ